MPSHVHQNLRDIVMLDRLHTACNNCKRLFAMLFLFWNKNKLKVLGQHRFQSAAAIWRSYYNYNTRRICCCQFSNMFDAKKRMPHIQLCSHSLNHILDLLFAQKPIFNPTAVPVFGTKSVPLFVQTRFQILVRILVSYHNQNMWHMGGTQIWNRFGTKNWNLGFIFFHTVGSKLYN